MYMKNVMYKIIMGCYIVAALVLVTACNDSLDIQQAYPFSIETLPVPKRLKVGETAEIRCQLVREGYYQPTTYRIRYFQPDGKGKLEMDNGTVFLPNDLYPLEKETFRLYYTSASTDQQTIDIYIIDSFGQMQQLTLSFNNDNSEDKKTLTAKASNSLMFEIVKDLGILRPEMVTWFTIRFIYGGRTYEAKTYVTPGTI